MRTLVIDTSTATLCLAIMEGGICVVESSEHVERRHSDRLLPAIEALLAEAQLTLQHVQHIAVGQGPGSYTGVRIGVTAAKTLAWTLGVPLSGISSLEALAYGARLEAEQAKRVWIVPLTDARRMRAYTAIYEVADGAVDEAVDEKMYEALADDVAEQQWRVVASDRVEPIDAWLQYIKQSYLKLEQANRPDRIIFVGEVAGFADALVMMQTELRMERKADIVSWSEQRMSAVSLGKLAAMRSTSVASRVGDEGNAGEVDVQQDDVHRFVPNYAQLAEAEAAILRNRA